MTVSLKRYGRGTLAAIAVLSVLVLPGAASAAQTAAVSPPDSITLTVAAINGTGCKPGTATVTASSDHTSFRVKFTDYLAADGGSTKATDIRRNCQLAISVGIPQGFTFAIASAHYRGATSLPTGADAIQGTQVYFQGSGDTVSTDHTFTGPRYGAWSVTDDAPVLTYAPCSETNIVNVDTSLRVHAGTSDAYSWISMGSANVDVDTLFNFSWKEC